MRDGSMEDLQTALVPRDDTVDEEVRPKLSPLQTNLGLTAMGISAFAIGTTEFVPTGLLPNIARSFDVSIPVAAWSTTAYAIGVGIGGPILSALTVHMPRKLMLSSLMALFVGASILTALAPNFWSMLLGRVLSAFSHGSFFGAGSVVVAKMVPPEKEAKAIALVFTGLSIAHIIGVPLGTLVGQHLGWRAPFWGIAGLGGISLLGLLTMLPNNIPVPKTNLKQELVSFKRPKVWHSLVTTAIGFSGLLSFFAYITPIMVKEAGFEEKSMVWILCIYGAGLVTGLNSAGWFADRNLNATIFTLLTALAAFLGVGVVAFQNKISACVMTYLLGTVGFGTIPPLQKQIMLAAEGAPTLASTMNIAFFNLGTALGVYLAGLAVHSGLSYRSPMWVGAALSGLGLTIALTGTYCCGCRLPKSQAKAALADSASKLELGKESRSSADMTPVTAWRPSVGGSLGEDYAQPPEYFLGTDGVH